MSKKKPKKNTLAAKADKHELYLASVQDAEHEVDFFNRAFKREYKRLPALLREDFCGTAAVCYEWVKDHPDREAIGVDLHAPTINWGRKHLTAELSEEDLDRVTFFEDDVLVVQGEKADVLAAQNFSFWIFKTRELVIEYFQAALENLADEGIMVIDMMGGSELLVGENTEVSKKEGGFKYVWEQVKFDPITHDVLFHIHFKFKDGSKIKKAFTYDWRMWTIPEVNEMLIEAGFSRVDTYWEGSDENGEGNDEWRVRKHGDPDPAWIAYMVAVV